MAKASRREETEEEAIERLAVLFKESDRGCALVGGAIVDEALADLLRAALAPDTDASLFGQDGVLGTLSSRTKLARAIGLINTTDFHDLDLVRKVRNDAAHFAKERGFATGFSTDVTKDRCRGMSSARALSVAYGFPVKELHPMVIFCVLISQLKSTLGVRARMLLETAAGTTRADALAIMLKFVERGEGKPAQDLMVTVLKASGTLDPRVPPARPDENVAGPKP